MELTKEQLQTALESDADALMEQMIMQHSRHMQMSSLVEYQLMYPDMTIRDFFYIDVLMILLQQKKNSIVMIRMY